MARKRKVVKKKKSKLSERELAVLTKGLTKKQKEISNTLKEIKKRECMFSVLQGVLSEREKNIKKYEAEIKASRMFLSRKESLLNKQLAELKGKEEVYSNIDLSNVSSVNQTGSKVGSHFIKDVLDKNMEMRKKERELNRQINDLKAKEETLHSEIDNILGIIEEIQR